MIEITGLAEHVYVSMISVFGEKIFEAVFQDCNNEGKEREFNVLLNRNAAIKFYAFDSSICIDLGAKKYIIEKNDFYKVELK